MLLFLGALASFALFATGLHFWPALTTVAYFVVLVGYGLMQMRHFPKSDNWRGSLPD